MLGVARESEVGLQQRAVAVRRHILTMIHRKQKGHTGGALSIADVFTALYFGVVQCDPADPKHPDRDRVILSKGHACTALYATLAERGFFPVSTLDSYYELDSLLGGHPVKGLPGVELATGSLGHGLSLGVGVALAAKMDGRRHRVFILLGDGECQEGSVWEAAMAAAHFRLDNLTAIVDRNMMSVDGATEDIMALEPFAEKWRAFGWQVEATDGHDLGQLVEVFSRVPFTPARPSLVIAHTIKGKGVDFMEGRREWHHRGLTTEEMAEAFRQLDRAAAQATESRS